MPYEPMTIDEKRRLGMIALDLRNAMLVGNRAPIVEKMWGRHTNPQPGDWVIETSTLSRLIHHWNPIRDEGLWDGQFTRYLRTETRTHIDEDGSESWSEVVHICENPDGTEFAWTNAEIVTVPLEQTLRADEVRASCWAKPT